MYLRVVGVWLVLWSGCGWSDRAHFGSTRWLGRWGPILSLHNVRVPFLWPLDSDSSSIASVMTMPRSWTSVNGGTEPEPETTTETEP